MPEKSIYPDDYGTRHNQHATSEMLFSGYVIDTNPKDCTIQVSQGDRSNVTDWVKVTQRSTTGMQDFHLPRKGAFVHMLKVPDATYNRAIILGESYTDLMTPALEIPSANARFLKMDSGTIIYADPNGKLYINAVEPIEVHTQGQVNLVSQGYVYVTCTNAKVQAANTELTGNLLVDGNTTIKGTLLVQELSTETGLTVNGTLNANGDIVHTGNMTTSGTHVDANGVHT
jgi:phage baseplate assembly protein gpV